MQRSNTTTAGGGGEKDNFRPDIEGLRGIAVLLVVLFHAALLSQVPAALGAGQGTPWQPFSGGFIGVDLFFVVSGYLITGLLIRERERTGKTSFSRFYARRVRRILPAAAVVLVVTLVLSSMLVTLIQRSSTMQDGAAAALSIANIRFAMTTDYFHPTNYSPFLHFWSLGVEEQFYFIWPAILAIVAWKRPRLFVGIALAVIVAVSLVASIVITDSNPSAAFYMLPTRAWQLGAGGLLAVGAGSLDKLPGVIRGLWGRLMAVAGWISLAVLLVAAFVISSDTAYPGTAAIVPTLAGVLLIASGMERLGPGLILRLTPIRFIGKISYSLYLWHWPMLILAQLYITGSAQIPLSPVQALVVAAFSIPVATVSWALIEEPFRRGQIPLPRPSRTVVAGVTVMVLVALLGTSFAWSADATARSVFGDTSSAATDTPVPDPTDTPFVATQPPASIPPGATPSPTPFPGMTAALTPYPNTASTSYSVAGLRPSVLNAPNDYEQPWHDNCLGFEPRTAPPAWGKCVYGNTKGTFQVALIGDSHASALFPAVNEVAKAHGWKLVVYLKIDCSFVDMAMEDFNRKNEYTECESWNRNVIAAMKAHPPNLAIVSQSRWIFGWPIGSNSSLSAQEQAMTREIQMIPASSKIVIIQDPPLPTSVNPPDCLSSNTTNYRACAFSRANAEGSGMGKREQYVAKAVGAGLINLTSYVCPGSSGPCPAVINGMIVWRDEHHFTATFAKTLAPAVDAQLVAIMNGWVGPTAAASPTH